MRYRQGGNHALLATPWSSGHTEETRTEFNSFLLFGIQMDDRLVETGPWDAQELLEQWMEPLTQHATAVAAVAAVQPVVVAALVAAEEAVCARRIAT